MATSDYREDWKGAWLLLVFVVLYAVGGMAGIYVSDWSFFHSPEGPGVDPPFYFIRRDFIMGICLGLTMFSSVAVSLYYRKRYPVYAWMTIWMSILWSGGTFVWSVVIVFKTTHLFTPAESTSSWPTFDKYLYNPLRPCAHIAAFILALTIAFLSSTYTVRARKRSKLAKEA